MREVSSRLVTLGIGTIAILTLVSILPYLNINLHQEASAYVLLPCRQATNTVLWRAMANLTAVDLAATQRSIAAWNNIRANVFLDQVTTGEHIQVYSANLPNSPGTLGYALILCNGTNLVNPTEVALNDFSTNSFTNHHREQVMTQEIGHALGLHHSDEGNTFPYNDQTIMYSFDTSYTTYKLFVPVLDDIRALAAWYGNVTSTSQCNALPAWQVNGQVTYSGTCSGTNPALPMTERITVAGSGNRAYASEFSTAQNLPTATGMVLMNAKVTPSAVRNNIFGITTSPDITLLPNRFMMMRAQSVGWQVINSDTGGTSWIVSLCSCAPVIGQQYWIQIVAYNGDKWGAEVYLNDGGGTDHRPPTRIASKEFNPTGGGLPWTSTVYYGTGVYQGGSSSTLANWSVHEFMNRLRSWT